MVGRGGNKGLRQTGREGDEESGRCGFSGEGGRLMGARGGLRGRVECGRNWGCLGKCGILGGVVDGGWE